MSAAPSDLTHTTLSVFVIGLLAAATFWVLSPFLASMLWAIVVCVAVWPLLLRLERALGGRRRLAVTIIVITLLLTVFVPVTLAVLTIVDNARNITADLRSFQSAVVPSPPAWLTDLPFGDQITATWTRFAALDAEQRLATLSPYAEGALQWFAARAGGIGAILLQFLLTTVLMAIGLAQGEVVRERVLSFAFRLGGAHGREVAILAAQTIRGVVLGVVVTALLQAAVAGAGLLIVGVPAAGLLTALILVLCLAQLGPMLVMLPIVGWLFWSGQSAQGWLLLVIAIVAGTLDGFVRPALIRRGANLPLVLIFAGVIGGLIAFGVVGLFIGPVVLTVTHTLLNAWIAAPEQKPS